MDNFIQALEDYRLVLNEYYRLECQPTLTETEADRVQAILEDAQKDPMLDFLIDEVDHILGHELGLIDEKFIQQQQEKLKFAIEPKWMEHLLSRHTGEPDPLLLEDAELLSLQDAQTRLKQEGLYDGCIDGVFGPITKQAFRALRRRIQERLEKQGLPTDSIDGILNKDRTTIETAYHAGKNIDWQEVDLLSLEEKFCKK
ncbi:MAG: peptidoglycan-binding protein [Plectolyngbya sp. WJT66-NPBG17]|jgi:hypothetical protein|nr:peptidoglycan-binding protein [Plectolyngbya sp. WJT66-NPBG17]